MSKLSTSFALVLLIATLAGCGQPANQNLVESLDVGQVFSGRAPRFDARQLPRQFRPRMELDWELFMDPALVGLVNDVWMEYDLLLVQSVISVKGIASEFVLTAIKRENGTAQWAISFPKPLQFRPVVTVHCVYVVVDNDIFSFERGSGRMRWRITPKDVGFNAPPLVVEPPTFPTEMEQDRNYDMEKIFISGTDRNLHAMQVIGRMTQFASAVPGVGVGTTTDAIVQPDYLFRRIWFKPTTGNILWEPIRVDNNIYFASDDSYLYCASIDGDDVFKHRLQAGIVSPVREGKDSVFFSSLDTFFYSFSRGENYKKWQHPLQGFNTREFFVDHNNPDDKLIFVPVRPTALMPENPNERARMLCIRHEFISQQEADGTDEKLTETEIKRRMKYEEHDTLWEVNDAMTVLAVGRDVVYLGASSLLPGADYNTITQDTVIAVEKATGKELWSAFDNNGYLKQLVSYDQKIDNDLVNRRSPVRMTIVSKSNHILSFIEPQTESGPYKLPENRIPKTQSID
ncbi:MAG: hypothetical protein ABIH86_05860 [Planctomycetota bacterium]